MLNVKHLWKNLVITTEPIKSCRVGLAHRFNCKPLNLFNFLMISTYGIYDITLFCVNLFDGKSSIKPIIDPNLALSVAYNTQRNSKISPTRQPLPNTRQAQTRNKNWHNRVKMAKCHR